MSDSYWSGLHLSRLKTPASICLASLLPGGAHGAKDADLFSGSSMISRNLTISTLRRKICFCFFLSHFPSWTDKGLVPTVAGKNQRKHESVQTFPCRPRSETPWGSHNDAVSPAEEGKCIRSASPASRPELRQHMKETNGPVVQNTLMRNLPEPTSRFRHFEGIQIMADDTRASVCTHPPWLA